ncbi:hypothetical protein E9529_03915 [Blastococcus sp. KM273128]|uniref:hypothetical protein n=1 Tax=Blastococcus sp. KM273128 TaxID=2570314 RepID=UPI001F2BE8A3|nr:hypothetical protein [Blastococcus sp. KM273128]MCF6743429.1 hypothetical protein [Blastococcus sp. KM273128]
MTKRRSTTPEWTDRDSALWHTCEIAVDLAHGTVPAPRLQVVSIFPPMLASDEQYWAAGPYVLHEERARGDGSYVRDSGFFFATGRGGLTATAAVAALRARGNSNRRKQAQMDAIPRWTPIDAGTLYLSRYGFHLHSSGGVWPWDWPSVTAAQMVGPAAVHIFGASTRGPVSWIVQSDWAELLFVAWAIARHPRHPQLLTGGWLPPGWLARCAGHVHPTRLTTPALQL